MTDIKIKKNSNLINSILCSLLIISIIFGDSINFGGIRVGGMVITVYRVFIPLIFIMQLISICKSKKLNIFINKEIKIFFIMILLWIIYGCIMLVVSDYSMIHSGIKELLNLTLALMATMSLYTIVDNKAVYNVFIKTLKVAVVCVCLYAYFEILTGYHLPTSKFTNELIDYNVGTGVLINWLYKATSTFYGENDLAAFAAIFFPLFIFEINDKMKTKIFNAVMMILIILLLAIDDSNICFFAIVISVLAMFFFNMKKRAFTLEVVVILVDTYGRKFINTSLMFIKYVISDLMGKNPQNLSFGKSAYSSGVPMEGVSKIINSQIDNANLNQGSMFERITIYKDAFRMTIDTKCMGVGPAGFKNYLDQNGSETWIRNPHNWWLEILSQYGLLIFLLYFISLIMIFVENIRIYLKVRDYKILQTIMICISFAIACIAPSSFIGYNYQWIIPTMGLINIKLFTNTEQ